MNVGTVTRYDAPRQVRFNVSPPCNGLPFVLIMEATLVDIFDHASEGYPVEIGGYCLGFPLVDPGSKAKGTLIEDVVPAISTSTRVHVTMHAETFHAVEQKRMLQNNILVGYYHSHPGLSVFQSGEDISNFITYHPEEYQIAIVADPTLASRQSLNPQEPWIGFFAWDLEHKPTKLPAENILLITEQQTFFDFISSQTASP